VSPIGIEHRSQGLAVNGPYHWATQVCSLGIGRKFTNTRYRTTKKKGAKNCAKNFRCLFSPEKNCAFINLPPPLLVKPPPLPICSSAPPRTGEAAAATGPIAGDEVLPHRRLVVSTPPPPIHLSQRPTYPSLPINHSVKSPNLIVATRCFPNNVNGGNKGSKEERTCRSVQKCNFIC
jgi:hypothetical protein